MVAFACRHLRCGSIFFVAEAGSLSQLHLFFLPSPEVLHQITQASGTEDSIAIDVIPRLLAECLGDLGWERVFIREKVMFASLPIMSFAVDLAEGDGCELQLGLEISWLEEDGHVEVAMVIREFWHEWTELHCREAAGEIWSALANIVGKRRRSA